MYFSSAYGACEKTIQYVCETTPADCVCMNVHFPIADIELTDSLRKIIRYIKLNGKKPRLAMFDTVVTFPGVRMPWEDLVKVCLQNNVLSLIDGAHGIGHIDLTRLSAVDPDFFTSNCYKYVL